MNALLPAPLAGQAAALTLRAEPAARGYLSFRIDGEHYGVCILHVQEIRRYESPTRLPGTASHSLGVLDLRGEIVPVADLRARLGAPVGFDATTVTIILSVAGRRHGLVVDAVADVHPLSAADIKPAPPLGGALDADCIDGISALQDEAGEHLLVLLDAERLVARMH